MDRNRRRLLAMAALAPMLHQGGCGAPALTRVGGIVRIGHEPLFLARELGLYDPRRLRLIEMPSNTSALTLDECLLAREGGVDLRVITVFGYSTGADIVMVRPEIVRLEDLKGLRIGVEETAASALMLFLDRLERTLAASRRNRRYGAVLFVDLDHFKQINDVHGHAMGDAVLCEIARRLQFHLRQEDTLARLGGDEFVVPIAELAGSLDDAGAMVLSVAEKLRSTMGTPVTVDGQEFLTGASIGITLFPKLGKGVDDLMREADTDMCRAKERGRNALVYFEPAMREAVSERYVLDQALCEACALIARLDREGRGMRVAVNVSPRQFRHEDFVPRVREILAATGADPTYLTLEITENLLIEHASVSVARMTELAALGLRFAIDDFGTGYSSLMYLKRLPLSELKVDKSFVQDVPHDINDVALVETILSVARHLHFEVVAEGVENPAQLAFLRSQGSERFQGYHFQQPQPVETWVGHCRPGRVGA